jgi:hypothetical protein
MQPYSSSTLTSTAGKQLGFIKMYVTVAAGKAKF